MLVVFNCSVPASPIGTIYRVETLERDKTWRKRVLVCRTACCRSSCCTLWSVRRSLHLYNKSVQMDANATGHFAADQHDPGCMNNIKKMVLLKVRLCISWGFCRNRNMLLSVRESVQTLFYGRLNCASSRCLRRNWQSGTGCWLCNQQKRYGLILTSMSVGLPDV